MSIERKVYSSWAFSENADKKRGVNISIYKELKEKYRISTSETYYNAETKTREPINADDYDVIVTCDGIGYAHTLHKVVKNEPKLSTAELALICDSGNLCFGHGMRDGLIAVYTD